MTKKERRMNQAPAGSWVNGGMRAGKRKRGSSTISGNVKPKLDQPLVGARVSSGLGKSKAKRVKSHVPSAEEVLSRVMECLQAAGLNPRVVDGRPQIEDFAGAFRTVPGYALCLDAPDGDIHFLPNETRFYAPTSAEQRIAGKKGKKGKNDLLAFPAGSPRARQILATRLTRLRTVAEPSPPKHLLNTQVGAVFAQELPQWLERPFNLIELSNGAASLRKNAARIALLWEDRAVVNHQTVVGDFRTPGRHWGEFDRALKALFTAPSEQPPQEQQNPQPNLPRASAWQPVRETPLPQPHKRSTPRNRPVASPTPPPTPTSASTIADVPAGADEELAELCMAASESIRLERNAVLPRTVELQAGRLHLAIAPIEGNPPRLRVPFELSFGSGPKIAGHLQLWTSDPLTLSFNQFPNERDLVRAWAAVLLAFADLTVWPDQELVSTTGATRSPRSQRPSAQRSPARTAQVAPRARRRYIGKKTRIDLRTLRAHFVVGHRRWLPDGWDSSAEKHREAASLGIVLEPGQTWVRPHLRAGSAAPRQITVDWNPPSAFAKLI